MRSFVILALLFTVTSAGLLDLKNLGKKFDDILDLDKFENLFKGNKINTFINNLTNVGDKTKKSLKHATKLHEGLDKNGKKQFNDFFQFIVKFGREYDNDTTTSTRFRNFQESLKRIESRQKADPKAKYGITKLSDLSKEEFLAQKTGIKGVEHLKRLHATARPHTLRKLNSTTKSFNTRAKRECDPDAFDWRDYGILTSVKDQGACGCCYAFAALGAAEAAHKLYTGEELDLSEQHVVSCTYNNHEYGPNYGCNGGFSDAVLNYVRDQGVAGEDDWPYESGSDGEVPGCQMRNPVMYISDEEQLPQGDEESMAWYVYNVGPIVTYLDADQIMDYQGGIIDAPEPSEGWGINHAVVTVGYGEEDGTPFWVIKNSWGEDYGEDGYFRVRRGTNSLLLADWNYVVYY